MSEERGHSHRADRPGRRATPRPEPGATSRPDHGPTPGGHRAGPPLKEPRPARPARGGRRGGRRAAPAPPRRVARPEGRRGTPRPVVPRAARRAVVVLLVLAALAVLGGIATLWPDSARVDEARAASGAVAKGVTFPRATVDRTFPSCAAAVDGVVPTTTGDGDPCNLVRIQVVEGEADGTLATIGIPPYVATSGLERGDTVRVVMTPADGDEKATYSYYGTERPQPVGLLAGALALLLVLVSRLRGLLSLVALAASAALVVWFVLPAVLTGEDAVLVGLTATAAMSFVLVYAAHGVTARTHAALLAALVGLGLAAGTGWLAVEASHLTGVADQRSLLSGFPGPDLAGLLVTGILVAGLGALVDVTTRQAASVWYLRASVPRASRRSLFLGALRAGRAHLAASVQTLALAYAGTGLVAWLVLDLYDLPVLDLVSTEQLGTAVVGALVAGLTLVVAMPVATGIASLVVEGPRPEEEPGVGPTA